MSSTDALKIFLSAVQILGTFVLIGFGVTNPVLVALIGFSGIVMFFLNHDFEPASIRPIFALSAMCGIVLIVIALMEAVS